MSRLTIVTSPPTTEAVDPHAIHLSLLRPVLVAGVEPEIAGVEATTVFALLFLVGLHVATIFLAAFYLLVVHSVMAWVARQDPAMVRLYLRSLTARDFYPPNARMHASIPPVRPSIPPSA